jgi:hypothetical protein
MTRISISRRVVVGTFLAMIWPMLSAVAQHGYTISDMPVQQKTGIMMPFQLANGHIKTPAFKVKRRPYLVDLIVRTDLSFEDWCCGIEADRPNHIYRKCTSDPAHRLKASWTLWDGSQLVAQGPSNNALKYSSNCDVAGERKKEIHLGGFEGKRGRMYVLDLKLTNVDSAFPISDAHLFVWHAPDMYP